MLSDGAKLVRAAQAGDDAKVKRLLKAKVDVNAITTLDGESATALQAASWHGHVGTARLLLKAKATVDARTTLGTALMSAADAGHAPVVQLLLDANATTTWQDACGKTALDSARHNGHAACDSGTSRVLANYLTKPRNTLLEPVR